MEQKRIKVIGHRGGTPSIEENTLAAFRSAVDEFGADGFECDVVLTNDGEPIIFHKPFYSDNIAKVLNRKGRLKDLNWNQIRDLRTIGGQKVLHLNDVLEYVCAKDIECFVEPKVVSEDVITEILKCVSQSGVEKKVRLITFYPRKSMLCESKRQKPNVKTGVMFVTPFGNWERGAELACADIVVPGWKTVVGWNTFRLLAGLFADLPKKIRETRSKTLGIYSGIADKEESIRWLCELNVDGIFSNNVPEAVRIVSEYRAQSSDFSLSTAQV